MPTQPGPAASAPPPPSPPCLGDPPAFNAGYGICATYTPGHVTGNFDWCEHDEVDGLKAVSVCSECGICGGEPNEGTDIMRMCQGSSATWNAGWGLCPSYESPGVNHAYCHLDSKFGLLAKQVCSECNTCESVLLAKAYVAPAPPTPACQGDSNAFDAGWGPCSSYEPTEANNYYCNQDKDDKMGDLLASAVCAQCGQCILAPAAVSPSPPPPPPSPSPPSPPPPPPSPPPPSPPPPPPSPPPPHAPYIVAGPMTDGAVDITVGFGSVTRNFTSLAVAFSAQLRVFRLLLRMPSTAASLTFFSARQRGTFASL